MMDSAKRTTFRNDIVPIFVTVGKAGPAVSPRSSRSLRERQVAGVFVILGTGNLLMAGLAYWMCACRAQASHDKWPGQVPTAFPRA